MARENDIDLLQPSVINIGTGGSLFVPILPVPGQVYMDLYYKSGGSMEILGGGPSFSYNSASFNVNSFSPSLLAFGSGFWLNAAPATPYRIFGPAAFWMQASGATGVLGAVRGIKLSSI